jgi:hypothetical protein
MGFAKTNSAPQNKGGIWPASVIVCNAAEGCGMLSSALRAAKRCAGSAVWISI